MTEVRAAPGNPCIGGTSVDFAQEQDECERIVGIVCLTLCG